MSLFWCGCCAFSWGTCGFPRRAVQLVTLFGFCTYLAPVSWPTPAVDVYCWVDGVLVHHLVFYLVPAQLPLPLLTLSGFCNLSGSSCWSTPAVEPCCWVGGVFVASLGLLPCAVLFLRGLPLAQLTLQQVPLGIFRSPGVCPSASLVTSVGHQPFPSFSVLLLLRLACRGSLGSAPCVGCSSWGGVCSLDDSVVTLLAFPYLRVGELLGCGSVGCEVCGLGCPSWFVLPFMSLFVLPMLLGWGGLVTGL